MRGNHRMNVGDTWNESRREPDPDKSKLVVRVFQLYSQGGLTFDMIGEQLHREGYIYRPSMPRMSPGSISYMLANRFYVGDIVWKGQIYPGKHRPLVDRTVAPGGRPTPWPTACSSATTAAA